MKVDGPLKWTVQKDINWTVVKMKVDSPQNMKLDGPQKCAGGQKAIEEHGPRIRWRSIRDESGRSKRGDSGRSKNAWVAKKDESGRSSKVRGRFKKNVTSS